jgi:RNA polymerase-binding transcription factor
MPAVARKAVPAGAKQKAAKGPSAATNSAKANSAKASKATTKQPGKSAPAAKKSGTKTASPKRSVTKVAPKQATPTKSAPAKSTPAAPRKTTVTCSLSGFEVTPGPPQLAPKTLERLRAKLLEEKLRLLRQSEELAAEAEALMREREAGDTQFDEESGEGDTVNVERERDLLLSASARQVVEEIDEALVRMKKGTYGVCKYAGRRISVERLEAIPWANVCVDCKARAERRR